MKYYLEQGQLDDHIQSMKSKFIEKGVPVEELEDKLELHIRKNVIIKYTKGWQDEKLKFWLDLIATPEGYWIAQEAIISPHNEFTHYKMRRQMSYERGNVPEHIAERELSEESFAQFQQNNKFKPMADIEVEIDVDINTNIYKAEGDNK